MKTQHFTYLNYQISVFRSGHTHGRHFANVSRITGNRRTFVLQVGPYYTAAAARYHAMHTIEQTHVDELVAYARELANG